MICFTIRTSCTIHKKKKNCAVVIEEKRIDFVVDIVRWLMVKW